jgi:hypothetical protein
MTHPSKLLCRSMVQAPRSRYTSLIGGAQDQEGDLDMDDFEVKVSMAKKPDDGRLQIEEGSAVQWPHLHLRDTEEYQP